MLELKKIKKSYKVGNFKQVVLNDFDLKFRNNEFVAILGPSGSGKTTLLNIIGGLDRYDSGDLLINGKSTKNFKEQDFDSYRNNCVGFIFQSYNLIGHISVLDNVKLGLTLSGISSKKALSMAKKALKRVGLEEHVYKKPNQLSGGQMQRVAIARALANNPDVILADEPTGALDSKTSKQIMELIKEIASEKLVIMVTHNEDLATLYANRIVTLKDGELVNDSNPIKENESIIHNYNLRKTAMSFLAALKLSFNNILTKKGRTLLTSFAASVGIIGISLILSLSNGFDIEIKNFEKETMSSFPILISQDTMNMNENSMTDLASEYSSEGTFPKDENIYPYKSMIEDIQYKNKITNDYMDYLNNIDGDLISGIANTRIVNLNILHRVSDQIKQVKTSYQNFVSIPRQTKQEKGNYLEKNYDLLSGSYPKSIYDLVLVVDANNKVDEEILNALGYGEKDKISFSDIINQEFKLVMNDDYYQEYGSLFTVNLDFNSLYDNNNNFTLRISGIVRIKKDIKISVLGRGLAYQDELMDEYLKNSLESNIVKLQNDTNYNVLTGQPFSNTSSFNSSGSSMTDKEMIMAYLGGTSVPYMIQIYPNDFDSKDDLITYLDAYNNNLAEEEKIIVNDLAKTVTNLSGNIMDAITVVLISFSAISLIVSSIMIGVITYISVLERTKEIGVLRSLGARKKDITRVFNAETFIIGITSGFLGILVARLLIIPANMIIEHLTDLPNVAKMNPLHALLLIAISILLTLIGGFIPAKIAAKKDPVVALRTE